MCGIFGIIDNNGVDEDINTLRTARDTLIHRGPDSDGEYFDEVVYLGFRRLAILDLSPLGNQPMSNEDETTWIIYNGEIYNYIELRVELEKKGHTFKSTSDTEVLIQLYDEFGVQMFSRLNGMFAIAIYDKARSEIILCRDRLGKKPLFYWQHDHTLAFASELRAFRKISGFSEELDAEAIALFLRLGWVPSWKCIYTGVRKLPAGTWTRYEITTNRLGEPHQYWNLPPVEIDEGLPEEKWLDRIEELLWDATRIRLRSDVSLGVFLSGGIDSGLIAAAASHQLHGNLASLTINFPDWEENEWPLAQRTATKLGINATQTTLQVDGMRLMPDIMAHFDEPFADSSALPTSLVCETAKKFMTVALSGDGGDELFAGYDNHVRAWKWKILEQIPIACRKAVAQAGIPFTKGDTRARRFLKRFCYPVGGLGMGSKLYPFEDWLNGCILPEYLLSDQDVERIINKNIPHWEKASPIDQAQRTDIRLYMLDDILVKVDRMSMRHSLEVRSPFLDYRIVELALRIPPSLRVKSGHNKYLLRSLAKRYLPREVVDAPKKGFGVPLGGWLRDYSQARDNKTSLIKNLSNLQFLLKSTGMEKIWGYAENDKNFTSSFFRLLALQWWI